MSPETINAITYKGETPLHIACMCHDVECTDLLLDAGANLADSALVAKCEAK
ncbi:ankyrin repeat domain-containing protein [Stenotrophomonas acidaminiphila]